MCIIMNNSSDFIKKKEFLFIVLKVIHNIKNLFYIVKQKPFYFYPQFTPLYTS